MDTFWFPLVSYSTYSLFFFQGLDTACCIAATFRSRKMHLLLFVGKYAYIYLRQEQMWCAPTSSHQWRCIIVQWEHVCLVHTWLGHFEQILKAGGNSRVGGMQAVHRWRVLKKRGRWWQGQGGCEVFKDIHWLGLHQASLVQGVISLHSLTRNKRCVGIGWRKCVDGGEKKRHTRIAH